MVTKMRSWWRAFTHRGRLESEMDTELRFHIESYIDDLVRSGVSHNEAVRRARIEFGGMDNHKEQMRASLGLRFGDERALRVLSVFAVLRFGAARADARGRLVVALRVRGFAPGQCQQRGDD